MIELNKETVCVSESKITAFSQAYAEADIIVPDVKPDIARILQVDADAIILNKSCNKDRVTVEGKVQLNILYVGDDNNVKSIVSSQAFSQLLDAKGALEGMSIELESDIENVDYSIVNSRKISVKVLIGLDVKVSMPIDVDLVTNVMGDDSFEILRNSISPYSVVVRTEEELSIREKLEIPSGKPSIASILKLDAKVTSKDIKLVSGKLIVKGMLSVTTLYLGEMEENNIQSMEHEIPFTEIVSAEGADEDMKASMQFAVKAIFYEVDEDSDGDSRIIVLEVALNACAKVSKVVSVDVIEDVYSVNMPLLVSRSNTTIDRIVADNKEQVTLKDVASMPRDLPEIMQVYNVITKPYLGNARIENNKIIVEGVIDSYILYLSTNEQSPLYTYKHEQRFCQHIDIDGIDENMQCDINLDMEHISYNISMGWEVDLRYILCINATVISQDKINYVTGVTVSEDEILQLKPSCCIRIYFVKNGDRMWDIAKRYHTTAEKIMTANEMTSEIDLISGKQILIP